MRLTLFGTLLLVAGIIVFTLVQANSEKSNTSGINEENNDHEEVITNIDNLKISLVGNYLDQQETAWTIFEE